MDLVIVHPSKISVHQTNPFKTCNMKQYIKNHKRVVLVVILNALRVCSMSRLLASFPIVGKAHKVIHIQNLYSFHNTLNHLPPAVFPFWLLLKICSSQKDLLPHPSEIVLGHLFVDWDQCPQILSLVEIWKITEK